jgi:NAD(P)H-dependent flavin oxidoreductase YrpB (nitropropane dioxygenase family)
VPPGPFDDAEVGMENELTERLGIGFPIFAFSHCRDVVAAVSRAGGLGVYGAVRLEPEQLQQDLEWLDRELKGVPYGIDLLFPARTLEGDEEEIRASLPEGHRAFAAGLADRLGIPPRAPDASHLHFGGTRITPEWARAQWAVALEHPIKLLASALGAPPADVVDQAHDAGMLVAGLVGAPKHATRQIAAGVDLVVAQGSEAGGHTGDISTMVLVPQVVDAAGPVPILAAGGIADGRQIAASFALGAKGVWIGSLWLTTSESDLHPKLVEELLAASSLDTVKSRCSTGKTSRQFRNDWVDAWQQHDAPEPLQSPAQSLLVSEYLNSAIDYGVDGAMCTPLGQAVGMMDSRRSVRAVMTELIDEYVEALGGLQITG